MNLYTKSSLLVITVLFALCGFLVYKIYQQRKQQLQCATVLLNVEKYVNEGKPDLMRTHLIQFCINPVKEGNY